MTVWTNEWAGASVLSVCVASAPGWLAVPLLRWAILEEKQAGDRVGSSVTSEPATRRVVRFPQMCPASFSHPVLVHTRLLEYFD